jgi:hypothetical protein
LTSRLVAAFRVPLGSAHLAYFCRPDGTPVLGLQSAFNLMRHVLTDDRAMIYDLTGPSAQRPEARKLRGQLYIELHDGSPV